MTYFISLTSSRAIGLTKQRMRTPHEYKGKGSGLEYLTAFHFIFRRVPFFLMLSTKGNECQEKDRMLNCRGFVSS